MYIYIYFINIVLIYIFLFLIILYNKDSLFKFFNEKYQKLLIEKLINVDESSLSKENFISTCQISSTLLIETYKKCSKHMKASNRQTVIVYFFNNCFYVINL